MIPALSFVFTTASALAVGYGAAAQNPVVWVPALVGLVCSAFLHGLSYWVFMEGRATPQLEPPPVPEEVLWNNPYYGTAPVEPYGRPPV